MGKKITRKEAERALSYLAKNIYDEIVNSGYVIADKFLTSHRYVDKGQDVEEFNCRACGATHTNLSKRGYYYGSYHYSRESCPSCGNKNYAGSSFVKSNTPSLYVKEADDGFQFAIYYKTHRFGELQMDDWYKLEPTVSIQLSHVGMFDNTNGWFVYDVEATKLYARHSNAESDLIERVKKATPINTISGDFPTMLAEANAYETKKASENAARKAASKTTVLEELRANYKPKPIDESQIYDKFNAIMSEMYSHKNGKATFMACCTKCGHQFETEEHNDNESFFITCPSCGFVGDEIRSYQSRSSSLSQTVAIFENTNLPENDMLMRVFRIKKEFSIDRGLVSNIVETQRIFFGKKVTVYAKHSHYYAGKMTYGDFEKSTIRDIDSCFLGWRAIGVTVQSGEEIASVIKNSCLVFSGLIESYGLGDKRYKEYDPAPSLKYLMTWYKKPAIELILKSNMTMIFDYLINNPEHIGTGKTLAEALQVDPHIAKIATKLDLNYHQLQDLSVLYRADNNLTADMFLAIAQMELPAANVARLKSQFNISYAQVMQYLDSVYNNQCIERREALGLWIDYLRMATALRIDLTDKARRYPGSLKKEHDVATFAYRAIQIEVDKETFAKQAAENAFYEYTYKDLIVVVPKTPQDIVEEATRQKNCLRSYVERVKNGDTVVAFVRRKIMPGATYVTAEIHNGELVQLKGYCNSNPRNKELVEFVQHWAKAKNIAVKC